MTLRERTFQTHPEKVQVIDELLFCRVIEPHLQHLNPKLTRNDALELCWSYIEKGLLEIEVDFENKVIEIVFKDDVAEDFDEYRYGE